MLAFARKQLGPASECVLNDPRVQTVVLARMRAGTTLEDAVLGEVFRAGARLAITGASGAGPDLWLERELGCADQARSTLPADRHARTDEIARSLTRDPEQTPARGASRIRDRADVAFQRTPPRALPIIEPVLRRVSRPRGGRLLTSRAGGGLAGAPEEACMPRTSPDDRGAAWGLPRDERGWEREHTDGVLEHGRWIVRENPWKLAELCYETVAERCYLLTPETLLLRAAVRIAEDLPEFWGIGQRGSCPRCPYDAQAGEPGHVTAFCSAPVRMTMYSPSLTRGNAACLSSKVQKYGPDCGNCLKSITVFKLQILSGVHGSALMAKKKKRRRGPRPSQ